MRRKLLLVALVFVAVLLLTGTAVATGNHSGVAERREITLDQPAWAGERFPRAIGSIIKLPRWGLRALSC